MKHYNATSSEYMDPMREYSRAFAHEVYPQKKKKKLRKRKLVTAVLLSLMSIFLVVVAAIGIYVGLISARLGGSGSIHESLSGILMERTAPDDPFYCLLLGTDGRPGETKYRSDTIILARVDPGNKQVTLVSIPRDTPVEIPGHGRQKINAAHAFGGPSQAVKTVSEFCGVPITHYVEVSFEGFKDVVDALGGVEVNVPVRISDRDAGDVTIDPGLQKLNGEQALTFCRSRKFKDGDFRRMHHQRVFIQALVDHVLNKSSVLDTAQTIDSLSKMVLTDMSVTELLGLMQQFKGMDASSMYTAVVPSEPAMVGGVAYVVPDVVEWKAMMERVKAGENPSVDSGELKVDSKEINARHEARTVSADPANSKVTVAIKNGSKLVGAGTSASHILKKAKFVISNVGDIDDTTHQETVVVYRNDSSKKAAEAIVKALGVGKVIKNDNSYKFNGDVLVVIGVDWAKID